MDIFTPLFEILIFFFETLEMITIGQKKNEKREAFIVLPKPVNSYA